MQIRNVQSAGAGLLSALLAASCCLIPLGLIAVGIGSVGWMMTMMRYQWLTIPGGILFLGLAYYSYFQERRRCTQAGCRYVGKRSTIVTLLFATGIVSVAMAAVIFPSLVNGFLHLI